MDSSLQQLIDRLNQLSDQFEELRSGVLRAVHIADEDPEMALIRSRKVLEYIVRDVYVRRVGEPPGTRPLENLIQRLVKDGHFPPRLEAYTETIRKLGNVGAHHFGEQVSAADVYQSLTQLMPILEWYFEVERPDVGVHLDVPSHPEARRPVPPPAGKQDVHEPHVAVVPKGLRSFDANDSRFFLQLLPGPRDENGLPESIRFWKHRIEATNDTTFTVGGIYGPSGCGKSSLVKAGLLPRLYKNITPVHVEATPDETETRLLNELRRRLPDLPADSDLTPTITALRQGHGLKPQQKALIILDQFEQWLHGHRSEQDTDLARALRQCDGEHIQCVLMVRDDFWMALTRFMSDLQIELVQGRNLASVDLFDPIHARKVLAEFGRSYGHLPTLTRSPSRDQETFLDSAVQGLAQDGRVVPIRLALFAEMVKGKPWTPATLKQVGGTEGVGVSFLEETFRSAALRPHQKAAQGVLKALSPETGTDIKGRMRSHDELIGAAGYQGRPREFDDLLRSLDSDVRLITPTEPERQESEGNKGRPETDSKYYQLTHDYLVPSLRAWLTRKQQETRRGRAEIRLAERSALWNAKPENRHLPSALEWASIRLLTSKRDWSEPQCKMMKRAGWVHGSRSLLTFLLLGLLVWGGIEGFGTLRAKELVEKLEVAPTEKLTPIIRELAGYRPWANPRLQSLVQRNDDSSREKLHGSLALLEVDPSQLPFLEKRLHAAKPTELIVIRDFLRPHRATLVPKLWLDLASAGPDDSTLLPTAAALADYDPASPRWDQSGGEVVQALVGLNPVYLGPWLDVLRPARAKLGGPLAAIFKDQKRPETERALAANILTNYASDDPALIADLLMESNPKAFAAFFPIAQRYESSTVPLLQAELAKQPELSWNDAPLDPAWRTADAALVRKIERTQGMVAERFAFCQAMPIEEFLATADVLRQSGYRPIRFRPYGQEKDLHVAALWTRDGRFWRLARDLSQEMIQASDKRNHDESYLPVDVCRYVVTGPDGKPADRYAALWVQKATADDDGRIILGSADYMFSLEQDKVKSAGLAPLTLQGWRPAPGGVDDDGLKGLPVCSVWGKSPTGFSAVASCESRFKEVDLPHQIAEHGGPLIDLSVSVEPLPEPSREWAAEVLRQAQSKLERKPDDESALSGRAYAYLKLGEYRKAVDDYTAAIDKMNRRWPIWASSVSSRAIAHARLGHKKEAWDDVNEYRAWADDSRGLKLRLALVVAAELGDGTERTIEELEEELKRTPQDPYLNEYAASAYAAAARALARKDPSKSKALADRASTSIREAVRNGYEHYESMLMDDDLDSIRDRPEFVEMMKGVCLDRAYAAVWGSDVRLESLPVIGLDPAAHLERCRELAAQGYRMVSISAAPASPGKPLLTASVWHRPTIADETRDQLVERQSRSAIALLRLGRAGEIIPLLRHSADPRLRSFIVNWLSPLGADPKTIAAELDLLPATAKPAAGPGQQFMDAVLFHPEASQRRALILALGSYGKDELSAQDRQSLAAKLLDLYRNDPDSGIHGATAWTLRKWGEQQKLRAADVDLMKLRDGGGRRWFVSPQGLTFAVIDGPVEFRMGSPLAEANRTGGWSAGENPHRRIIRRRFAIATEEVSIAQYREFMMQNPGLANIETGPDPTVPVTTSWFFAAAYCDWLSRLEKLPQCYAPRRDDEYDESLEIRDDVLSRTGYRLPTEGEWEYACRAGAATSRYYGSNVGLLWRYAWYGVAEGHARPCGDLLPNELGLFDMLGNVGEWCLSYEDHYQTERDGSIYDHLPSLYLQVTRDKPRIQRGGWFNYNPTAVRSADRSASDPRTRVGFRPVRTLP